MTVTDPMTGKTRTQYEYDEAGVSGEVTRPKLVAAMVKAKYGLDEQIALLANSGDKDAQHQKELADYQAFRKMAKGHADSVGHKQAK